MQLNNQHLLVVALVTAICAGMTAGCSETDSPRRLTRARERAENRVTPEERAAAATRARALGLAQPLVGVAQMANPDDPPHYFGPFPNYANSPLRMSDAVIEFVSATGTGAAAIATVDPQTGAITAIDVIAGGTGYVDPPQVVITSVGGGGTGAAATASVAGGAVVAVTVDSPGTGYVTQGIRKFVDTLPGVGPANANNLGQYIPAAIPDTTGFPGADYYEIAVVQYREKLHSDLPPTLLRGYVQLETPANAGVSAHIPLTNALLDGTTEPVLLNGAPVFAVDAPHYLGPAIAAEKDRPVRVLFRNLLPDGVDGNLFLPVDTTIEGSGAGPNLTTADPDPRKPQCGATPKPAGCFTENRATLHLHGGITPWISDGTPHQWVTPPNEVTPYPRGVSAVNVTDMPDPGPGAMTFFYSNQQSARLLFYHDHSWGITRLNVYAGNAAPYTISDPVERSLIDEGIIPPDTIPLVIQDKTFVPAEAQLATEDPTWNIARWGGEGSLWLPHVYMSAQNPGDAEGVNAFGRWHYGPWFWPPTTNIAFGPIANPYFDPNCDSEVQFCEPPQVPGTPFNSYGMESFHDTPLVNGTAYPTVTVEPKAYRLRILNGSNDRFWNLMLFTADATGTEVSMLPAQATPGFPPLWPTDGREGGVPDPATSGPTWIQIASEGGFLPAPAVIPPQPITFVTDPTVFNFGNAKDHALLLGPAERADVIVDFSQFAGQTLILFNDAPAAFPARDPRYDYYTGGPDLRDTGGAPSTPAGFGPNTRTVMQIKVAASPVAAPYDLARLQTAFRATALGGEGVFQRSQKPIVVGQAAYNSAYASSFRSNFPRDGFVRITDFQFTFNTLLGQGPTQTLTFPLKNKAIQDEMGEAFDPVYGRMSGFLGLEAPTAQAGAQNLILYPYINPASEIIDGVERPRGVLDVTPISTADDGTQIWKITHNGVDTHPIHFHLYDIQLINRVGWDGAIRAPDPNELGWKDTLRISPLEDTIVALRPVIPKIPFGVPDSIRPLDPAKPIGSTVGFRNVDFNGNPITPPLSNQLTNFLWEYVWHCHILSHEEADMMRPVSVLVERLPPAPPVITYTRGSVNLTWTDGTPLTTNVADWGDPRNETGYRIERAPRRSNGTPGTFAPVGTALANQTTFTDTTDVAGTSYFYRVAAFNAAGTTLSRAVLVGPAGVAAPAAPANLVAQLLAGPQVRLTFTDTANNETGFVLERSTNGGTFIPVANLDLRNNTGAVVATDATVGPGRSYQYRVKAVNGGGSSAYAVSNLITIPVVPFSPSALAGSAVVDRNRSTVTLSWTDNATTEDGFVLERATNAAFTADLTTTTLAANTTTFVQTGLRRGTTYFFRVSAFNLGGTSAPSNVLQLTTP